MVRKQIEHEDELINQRLNWFLVTQGFLMAAFGTVFAGEGTSINAGEGMVRPVLVCMCLVGTLLSVLSFFGIRTAHLSIKALRETWVERLEKDATPGSEKPGFPRIIWEGKPCQWSASYTTMGTPLLFVIVWLVLMFIVTLYHPGFFNTGGVIAGAIATGVLSVGFMVAKMRV